MSKPLHVRRVFEVIPPGTTVALGITAFDRKPNERVLGIINAVKVTAAEGVEYDVVYWNGYNRQTAWVSDNELLLGEHEITRIGFKQ